MTRKTITVLGLGEAGSLYAKGLASEGAKVKGFDPYRDSRSAGIDQYDDMAEALAGADVVLSLVGANAAAAVAAEAASNMVQGSIYADLNTASPAVKSKITGHFSVKGVDFVDVAVLAPVPRAGHRTPLLASGPGADSLASLLGSYGVDIESIGGAPGDAASRKLLRSVFMKGLAALVLETTAAGEAAGQKEWIRSQIANELGPDGEELIERLITGTYAHAERRQHEVRDALDYLADLGAPHWITEATWKWISSLARDGAAK